MRRAVLILLGLLAGAFVALIVVAPKLKLGGSTISVSSFVSVPSGGSLEQTQRIAELERELERLKEQLVQEQSGTGASTALAVNAKDAETSVTIDLMDLLGMTSFWFSITWDPYKCSPPYKTVWPTIDAATIQNLTQKLTDELQTELARIQGVNVSDVDPKLPYHQFIDGTEGAQPSAREFAQRGPSAISPAAKHLYKTDPKFKQWRSRITVVMSKYMALAPAKRMILEFACKKVKAKNVQPEDMGTDAVDCTTEMDDIAILNVVGYYATPYESVHKIAKSFIEIGLCTAPPRDHKDSFAQYMRTERMFKDEWMTFAVDTPEQDAVVLMFDMMYEKQLVFTRQYWLGVITMQNPFDMYSIQDIIYSTRPDLLIETGTANGGSALLWASVFDLADMNTSKVVTMDVMAPKWEGGTWGGKAREDPTKHRLWNKHVQFLLGSTTDPLIFQQVVPMAAGKKVMVLLDSHHSETHVTDEMNRYCPLVSVGSYCIVEDTKMSRWHSTGPLESVKNFLAKHPEFAMDRSRELLYSQHAMGYLKRIS